MKKIETERLILREMTPEDFDRLYAVLADSGITPIPSAMLKATPHNCVCESQPPFCPTSEVPKMGNIAQLLPAQAGLRMRRTPCGYIQYSSIFGTLNWNKNPA